MAEALQLARISKSFGTTRVLDDVTVDARPGEFISLVGESGCGKSTLLRIIAGLEAQDAGSVVIGGRGVDRLSPRARNIAMVFQNYALYPHMSVFDNIALPLAMSRLTLPERLPLIRHLSPRRGRIAGGIAADVCNVAAQLRIERLLDRKPGQLSGGQRQRVALARALVRQPSLFLMDEPLSNLDAQLRVHMRDEISDLHARLGTTFIYVTHDQVEAMTMSNRVAMMEGGRIAQIGSPSELYDTPATLSVARFIGSPAINVLTATGGGDGRPIHADRPLPILADARPGEALSLGIRPEHVVLAPDPKREDIVGRVRRVEHHGPDRLVQLDLDETPGSAMVARLPDSEATPEMVAPGTFLRISFDASRAHVFGADGRRVTSRPLQATARPAPPVRAGVAA